MNCSNNIFHLLARSPQEQLQLRLKELKDQQLKEQYEKLQLAPKIPRPPNAFMLFANEWRKKLAFQYPRESNKDISVR